MEVSIEGTVGSGKSTFGKFLSEKINIKLYEELVNSDTPVLLDKFYKKQKRWSFALQIHFLNQILMIKKQLKNIKEKY